MKCAQQFTTDTDNYQNRVTAICLVQTMKAFIPLQVFFTALAAAHAIPLAETELYGRSFQPVTLDFQAGPASYSLNLFADGQEYFTRASRPSSLEVHYNWLYGLEAYTKLDGV